MADYLDGIVAGAMAGYHCALATAFVGSIDARAGSLGGAAGFLYAALDIVSVIGAVAGHVEPRKYTIAGLLASTSAMLLIISVSRMG